MNEDIIKKRNRYEVDGKVGRLTITRRSGEEHVIKFDAKLLDAVQHYVWSIKCGAGGTQYVTAHKGVDVECFLHHLVIGGRPPAGQYAFFRDNDFRNCLAKNIGVGDSSAVMLNSKRSKANTGFGYLRENFGGRWEAYGSPHAPDVKRKYLGTFDTREQAQKARKAWNRKFRGK